jgi:hypothetical protein
MGRLTGLILLLVLGISAAQAAEKYRIDPGVWSHYQEYLRTIGSTKAGAFAVTTDGQGSFYTYCPGHCVAKSYGTIATRKCEEAYESECFLFAVRDEIRVDYEILE